MPGNDLSECELLRVLYCDWPRLAWLNISKDRDVQETRGFPKAGDLTWSPFYSIDLRL